MYLQMISHRLHDDPGQPLARPLLTETLLRILHHIRLAILAKLQNANQLISGEYRGDVSPVCTYHVPRSVQVSCQGPTG